MTYEMISSKKINKWCFRIRQIEYSHKIQKKEKKKERNETWYEAIVKWLKSSKAY
jgi:hypothetical protein